MPRRKKEIVVDETISQNEELRENENEPIEAPKLLMETHISKVKKERTEK